MRKFTHITGRVLYEHEAFGFDDINYPSNWLSLATAEEISALGLVGEELPPLPITAANVKVETQRRIIALVGTSDLQACIIRQLNMLMRAIELANKRAMGVVLTAEESAQANALQATADTIKGIRARSNQIEALTPIPADFASDARWI